MAEKLSEISWVAFAKTALTADQRKLLDTTAFVKALAALDKQGGDKPAQRLEALEEVVEQIKKQVVALARVKKTLGDKPFREVKEKLDDFLDIAEKQQKTMQSKVAAEKSKAEDEGDDEEEATPALLSTRMIPLMRELRKGETRMHALVCTAGANASVLIMRKPISTSRRKLLAEAVDAKGGMKYLAGECVFEKATKTLVFELKGPASGLAKRLREALLNQVGMRLKVKVRGEGGEDVHGEDEGDETDAPGTPTPPREGPEAAAAFKQRLTALVARLPEVAATSAQAAAAARLKMSEAGGLAGKRDFVRALAMLDEAEALLQPQPREGAPTDWARRLAEVEARYLALLQTQPANASALRAAMDGVTAASGQGDTAQAEAALKKLKALMDEAGSLGRETDVIPEGLVAARIAAFEQAQQRWETGVAEARMAMKPIQAGLTGEFAAAVPAIDNILGSYRQELAGLLAEARSSQDSQAVDSATKRLRAKVGELRAEIGAEKLFAYLDESGAPITPTFESALDDIEALISR